MRRILLFIAAAVACGCGSDPVDNAPNFAGLWAGQFTETDNNGGGSESYSGEVNFVQTGPNKLQANNFCYEHFGPTLTTTSATDFVSAAAYSCPPVTVGDCGSTVLTYLSVSGNLVDMVMRLTADYSLAGCGLSGSATLVFSGTRDDSP
jgi:hypothetical protein